MSRGRYALALSFALSALVGPHSDVWPGDYQARDLGKLLVLGKQEPRVYFFRISEGFARGRNISYEDWDKTFARLMGIQGKALDEEIPGTSVRNVEWFTRFKKQHPQQLVLLHYNGRARDPRHEGERFFAGHWLYRSWTKILSDVPEEEGETDVRVANPENSRTNIGYYGHRHKNDELILCATDEKGKPNFHESEQVRVVSVNAKKKIVRVERGYLGSKVRSFRAGRAMAARHIFQGPCGRKSNLMWNYNFSTRCPRDAQGRSAADVLLESLVEKLRPGGALATFDGVQFDVLMHDMGREADCDGDGRPDNGIFDGVNTFGIGVIEFCRRLREQLGEDRLILADGCFIQNQRAFGLLNGIESEGWPALNDSEIRDWSGGLNRHLFWARKGRSPVFNYINHRYVKGVDGRPRRVPVPFSRHRLVFAAALFTDSAICAAQGPPRAKGQSSGVWDEFWMGAEKRLGWLGKPLGSVRRLAKEQPDLLEGAGSSPRAALLKRISGDGLRCSLDEGAVRVESSDPNASKMRFAIEDVVCQGRDLFVSVTMRGKPMKAYPKEMARMAWVSIFAPERQFVRREMPRTGMCIRGKEETECDPNTFSSVRWQRGASAGGERRAAYAVHPPGRGSAGYTFWERDVRVPKNARLQFFTGMGERAPGRSDGVVFKVEVAELTDGGPGKRTSVFEHHQVESKWVAHSISLSGWAGKTVCLRFVSDCGPKNDTTTDHSLWGDVWVLRGDETEVPNTQLSQFMTWVNDRDFESGFFFGDVRARSIDLGFEIEGAEPVWISSITVHAHPDAIVREYERGAVLANPSLHRHTFDLASLFPGQRFRRLRATPAQDGETNNGQPVDSKVTLEERDALFLVKQHGETR